MRLGRVIAGVGVGLWLAKVLGDIGVRRFETLAPEDMDLPGKTLSLDGLHVHYEEAGEGPAVVLVHGLGASTFSYRHNIRALATRFRVIALDLPGFGFSSRQARDLSVTAQVERLARFLDGLGIERASLVGHSMGGAIVLRFAATYPERVERLALLNPATHELLSMAALPGLLLVPFLPLGLGALHLSPRLRRRWLSLAAYDPAFLTPLVLAGYARPGRVRGNTNALKRWFRDRGKDLPFDSSAISAPVLIVLGEADRVISREAVVRLRRRLPDAEVVVVPRAAHWAPEERPEIVNKALMEFLCGCQISATGGGHEGG